MVDVLMNGLGRYLEVEFAMDPTMSLHAYAAKLRCVLGVVIRVAAFFSWMAFAVPTLGQTFSAATLLTAHTHPNSVATGDFNSDGKVDLLVSNRFSNDVSILLGDGNGGFGTPNNYDLLPYATPSSIAVGDFNLDGKADFVVTNNSDVNGYISLALGNGDGTFQPPARFVTGYISISVVADDFDIDGDLDVAVVNQGGDFLRGEGPIVHYSPSVSVLSGDGSGNFAAPVVVRSYSSFDVPTALAAGDFNDDGIADLAVTNTDSRSMTHNSSLDSVSILLGRRTIGVGPPHDIALPDLYPRSVVTRDFNNDGELDLALCGGGANVYVLLGEGSGDFAQPASFPIGGYTHSISAADFNGDGNFDLVTVNSSIPGLSLISGNGNGTFAAPVVYSYDFSHFITVVDFNGDRKADIALADTSQASSEQYIKLIFNTTAFKPASPVVLTMENSMRAVAVDSVTLQADPFAICTQHNFSSDHLTRILLFTFDDLTAMAGGDIKEITVQAQDASGAVYPLVIENVGPLANVSSLTQITVKLASSLSVGNVWITISVGDRISNKVLVKIAPSSCS